MLEYPMILRDLFFAGLCLSWVYFVAVCVARNFYIWLKKRGRDSQSSSYLVRKFIHIVGGGIFLFFPFIFKEVILPFLFCIILAFIFYYRHLKKQRFFWFQIEEKKSEVIFCLSAGFTILLGWWITKSMWFGIVPVLFMALGDGVTGIVRGLKYGKQKKYWEGSAAMLAVSVIIGLIKFGIGGIFAALGATLVERLELIDDNISIPFVSLIILIFFWLYFPSWINSPCSVLIEKIFSLI